jgi:hypothetical protein
MKSFLKTTGVVIGLCHVLIDSFEGSRVSWQTVDRMYLISLSGMIWLGEGKKKGRVTETLPFHNTFIVRLAFSQPTSGR